MGPTRARSGSTCRGGSGAWRPGPAATRSTWVAIARQEDPPRSTAEEIEHVAHSELENGAIQRDQQGQPGLHVPSQQWPPEQKSPCGQQTLPHCTRHVSMIVPAEFRMTALQCTAQPT